MKGVVLCGGTGSRLDPLTRVTNKHLLPIYDRPMVFYPIQTLVGAGIDEIMIVTGGNNAGDFVPLLRNGEDFPGLRQIFYGYQKGAGGIADALRLARDFADDEPVAVILGDNVFGPKITGPLRKETGLGEGAVVFLKEVDDPARFGVAEVKGKKVVSIEEKPKKPKSRWAVTGLYLYDATVFDKIETLKPSGRGELEITDVNNAYLRDGALRATFLGDEVYWTDAGTFESLHRANGIVAKERGTR
jgi:glucose-1-phosphate thymidylyltransferase